MIEVRPQRRFLGAAAACCGVLLLIGSGDSTSFAATAPHVSVGETLPLAPLPVDVALTLRGHNGRSPINLSADGEWLAHTIRTAERVERGSSYAYADSGFPFAEGDARMEVTLSNMRTGETIRVGAAGAVSWAPSWSPDGTRLAFYSDAGGTAGVWIWERASGIATRAGSDIARPFFGFESPRWSPDGRLLLVKLLPDDTTLGEANALLSRPSADAPPPEPDPSTPRVNVRLSRAATPPPPEDAPAPVPSGDDPIARRRRGMAVQLAVLDLESGRFERITEPRPILLHAFSPDGRRVAYSDSTGYVADAQQALYAMHVVDLDTGTDTLLADEVPLRYGIEWSWSPDGQRLAWIRSGSAAEGEVVVVEIPGGTPRRLDNDAPHLSPGEGEIPPRWSADGSVIYGIGDGALWRIDPESGTAAQAVRADGWQFRHLVTADYASPVVFSNDGGETLWIFARSDDGDRTGLLAVRPATGNAEERLVDARAGSGPFSLAAHSATGQIVFTARSQQQPGELFAIDTSTEAGRYAGPVDIDDPAVRRVSGINGALDEYALGQARLIDFHSTDGQPLRATLLTPKGYSGSRPLPTVVWVYGGDFGSAAVNRFGLSGSAVFNMHVLASRGYAVLFPDAPLRTGHTTEDLAAAVLPAVNAAVKSGIADPERLAIMGQSYGSLNVLALLTRTDRFDAAVITAAVLHPDLFADYLRDNTGYYETGQGDMGGTIWEVPERYHANSPLFDFERIDTPLLIGQGELDGDLVPSEAIFNALDRLGKQVEYRVYEGESHVITGAANVRDFWQRRLEFLAEHLRLEVAADGSVSTPEQH